MSFGPMALLIIVDLLLLVAVGGLKLKQKFYNRGHRKEKRSNRKTFTKPGRFRNRDYSQLHDEQLMVAREQNDIAMEERIMNLRRKPTGFEEFAELEGGIGEGNMYNGEDEDEAMSTDLQLFVQSLSKCLGATKFGLTFEFEDLKFHPPKAKKPILSNVSGLIDAGSLWGVMGASGAGKCKLSIDSNPRCIGVLANKLQLLSLMS
jgi:ABC-type multidrug transport system fused ATPase/permease subunit